MSAVKYPRQNPNPPKEGDCHCSEKDNPTQQSINTERGKLCLILYDASGQVAQQEKKFKGENDLYEDRKCLFRNTEDNYRRYRNLDITVGTELLQTNDSVKNNVADLSQWNKDLNAALRNINKAVKDVKAKFGDLKAAACQLESCKQDTCNKSQWIALTGEKPENCTDTPNTPPPECSNAKTIFEELICMPKGLAQDIDGIFQASSDVIGIQVFSNIDTLVPLQKTLETQSKDFESTLNATMKQRNADLAKLQDDLVSSVKAITKAAMDRNSMRSKFEGYKGAVDFLCCPDCDCLDCGCHENTQQTASASTPKTCDDYSKPRLEKCEKEICDICDEVKKTFCCPPTDQPPPPGDPQSKC